MAYSIARKMAEYASRFGLPLAIADGGTGKTTQSPTPIMGLALKSIAGTTVTTSAGSALIPATGAILDSLSDISVTVSPVANTWYHAYVYLNAGVPAIELVTTSPVKSGVNGWVKTSDTTRRYLYSLRSSATAGVWKNQTQRGLRMDYGDNVNDSAWFVYNGTIAGNQTLSAANQVPVTGTIMYFWAYNQSNNSQMAFADGNSTYTLTDSVFGFWLGGSLQPFVSVGLNSAQQFKFRATLNVPSASQTIACFGYEFER